MKKIIFIILMLSCFLMYSCEKFLDEKGNKTATVPATMADLQALLDGGNQLNFGNYSVYLETCTDDYFLGFDGFDKLDAFYKEIYTFQNPESGSTLSEITLWRNPFNVVAVANTVLDYLPNVAASNHVDPNNIRGQALFHRAFAHFLLAQVYCAPYNMNGDNSGLGLPLRLTSDINGKSIRVSIKQTYASIIDDLSEAVSLLSNDLGVVTRPNRIAACAALSRVYMAMEDYENASKYAAIVLGNYDMLMDLNSMNLNANFPYPALNLETIFFAYSSGLGMFRPAASSYMSEDLIKLHDEHDLRLKANYKRELNGNYTFKGSYVGSNAFYFFVGLTTSETILDAAESNIRLGNIEIGRGYLNHLLKNRIDKKFFVQQLETDPSKLLKDVLDERRKELVRRGIRWSDLRRLNKDSRFKTIIERKVQINNEVRTFVLPPNSKNYVYKIPIEVINMTGMEQN